MQRWAERWAEAHGWGRSWGVGHGFLGSGKEQREALWGQVWPRQLEEGESQRLLKTGERKRGDKGLGPRLVSHLSGCGGGCGARKEAARR